MITPTDLILNTIIYISKPFENPEKDLSAQEKMIIREEKANNLSKEQIEKESVTINPVYELAFANYDGELKGCAMHKKKEVGIFSYNSGKSGKDWVFKYLDGSGNFYGKEFKCHEYELSDIEMKPKENKNELE